mgnify:CR=1 FL=1
MGVRDRPRAADGRAAAAARGGEPMDGGEGARATSLPPDRVRGLMAHDGEGSPIGEVVDVYVDPETGQVLYLAVGSQWFPGRRHLIPAADAAVGGGRVDLPYAPDLLSVAPTFEPGEDLTLHDESDVLVHFGFEGYEDVPRARQTPPAPTPEIARAELGAELRSGRDPVGMRAIRWEG